MGDVSDEEKRILQLLGDPRSAKEMLIMLKDSLPPARRQQAEFAALAGTDVSTYNVAVPEQTRANNIEYVIYHLHQPLEYGVEPGKSGSPIFGIFAPIGDEQFAMRARLLTADLRESMPMPSMFGDDDAKYYWDEAANKMRAIRPTDAWGSTTNPAIRDRIFILEQDLLAVMNDKDTVKLLLRYLGALFEASDKYLKTDNDADIFFRILDRHRFPHIERETRKRLWDIPRLTLELVVHVLARHIEGSSHITEPDKTALQSTLSTLSSFVTSVSSQAWLVRPPPPGPSGNGPVHRLRSSVTEAMRNLGAFISKRSPGPSDTSERADSTSSVSAITPSSASAPPHTFTPGQDIDAMVRIGEADADPLGASQPPLDVQDKLVPPPLPLHPSPRSSKAPSLVMPAIPVDAAGKPLPLDVVGKPLSPPPLPAHPSPRSTKPVPSSESPLNGDGEPLPAPSPSAPPLESPSPVPVSASPLALPSRLSPQQATSLRASNSETPYEERSLWQRPLKKGQKLLDEMHAIPEQEEDDAMRDASMQPVTEVPAPAVIPAAPAKPPTPPPLPPRRTTPVMQSAIDRPGRSFLQNIRSRLSPRSKPGAVKPVAESKPVKRPVLSLFRRSRKKSGGSRSRSRSRTPSPRKQ